MKTVDVVVVGGGIAGLWTLAALRLAGYHAVLLEKQALGCAQTLASQGIIHGGTKYALTGKLTGSSEAVRSMPARWKQHLAAEKQPDLSAVKINTAHQWMWDAGSVTSRISSFFASKVMSSRVQSLAEDQRPDFLKGKNIYQLQEPVLDVSNLLSVLAEQNRGALFKAEVVRIEPENDLVEIDVVTDSGQQVMHARSVVSCAGAGNEPLQTRQMQRRPLQMVMVKGGLPGLWGHVIEANANPRLTITSHRDSSGEIVWYIGGQLAEDGAVLEHSELIRHAKQEMSEAMPAIDWNDKQWATLAIDRAEGRQPGNRRPDEPVIKSDGRVITVWPTKLVFAPMVADEVISIIGSMGIEPSGGEAGLPDFPPVDVGDYPWDVAEWTS